MKNTKILLILAMLLGCQQMSAQVLRSFTPRYNNPSVKGNIVFVANNIVTTSGEPTSEMAPSGSGVNNDNDGVNIDIDGGGTSETTILAYGESWKYWSTGATPAGSWKTAAYADGAWPSGNGQLGYGDGDEATCIPSGGGGTLCVPTGNKYLTSYFRKTFTIANPSAYGAFTFYVLRDDGFVLYLNGTEITRDNLTSGTVSYSTLASSAIEDDVISITIASSKFLAGSNTIAVEMHQSGASSSDLSFDLKLVGTTAIASLISSGDTWKYWANTSGNAPSSTWKNTGFADGAWPSNVTEMGYGDGDESFCVPSGGSGSACSPGSNKYITTYFRKEITIASPTNYRSFKFTVKYDDGMVLYINGTELARANLPTGSITYSTLALGDEENTVVTYSIPNSYFVSGTNTIAVEVHQVSSGSSDLSFDLTLDAYTDIIIQTNSEWKYLDNNTRPANWETSGYNDASWSSGYGYFGYGDSHINTTVSYGGNSNNKYITTYFRKSITIANPSAYVSYILKLNRDDGAIVYINGVEVIRSNLPTGTITHSTTANSAISGAGETGYVSYYLSPSNFVAGTNVIAVEIHQDSNTSTDVSFDLSLEGSTDETYNSSSADLTLPSCSQVLFAGLYWGATQGKDGTNTSWIVNETSIKLKLPGSSTYTSLTATQTDYHNSTLVPGLPHTGYRCFRDITSLVNVTNANGTYTIANVVNPTGVQNSSAGWTIVVAYSDPATIVRNLTVFDGSVIMNGGDPALTVPISGFLTPPSGPVSIELGAVVFDGDRVSTDEFSFKQNSNPLVGSYSNLTPNATANLNDMWNSTISYKGTLVTTRNPAYANTLGYDADIIEVDNTGNSILGNNQSSASIRFSSPSENYMIQVASTAISQYTPTFNMSKSSTDINGGTLLPGDEIRYQIDYTNSGNDASTATTIFDNIPTGTTYKPGSLRINGVAKSDASANDEAEYDFTNNRVVFRLGTGANGTNGGEVAPSGTGTVTFEVYTSRSCEVFACNSTISNRARISYGGKLSLLSLYDSSGVISAGCNNPGPVSDIITGSCAPLGDTVLTNICPVTTVTLPEAQYAGYTYHSGIPFTLANRYNPANPISVTGVYYAYFDGPGSCDDTIRINVFITACPDIDDDNDGIPDYVEINNSNALGNHDGDGFPNWNDAQYPGYVDNNTDGFNDNFDPSADSDNDGIPNFYDPSFPGWIDSNVDGVNDTMDKDLDGIPNHLDLDSDNDGIPDTVESFGVDANGDGRLDNYSDTDNDGFSQNVDGSGSGVSGSGTGLGVNDSDGDGVGNYLDLDSDNDGIPDMVEVFGVDANNNGKDDTGADTDGDGFNDSIDGDTDNDGNPDNAANTFLRTGSDGNSDGRADSWPYKNFDSDARPNPYDVDSDNDGITDVKEAQFADTDWNGMIDGAINTDGRNTAQAALGSLSFPNTDGTGRENMYDIDSDDDGIPDHVEGLTTFGYVLPVYTDADSDGLIDTHDNIVGWGGEGIHVVDTDTDGLPDYLDLDTDGDGLIDRVEGNDLNLNGLPDDLVSLLGTDTDGDGLDDRFDANNSSFEGTSARMGNGGSTTGDPTPGSTTTVQRTANSVSCGQQRDWRCYPYVLNCEIITFKGNLKNDMVTLDWTVLCKQQIDHFVIERSLDRVTFDEVAQVMARQNVNEAEDYVTIDNISNISQEVIYYRLRTLSPDGKFSLSNIIAIRRSKGSGADVIIFPNPVRTHLQVNIQSMVNTQAKISIVDGNGRTLHRYNEMLLPGTNSFTFHNTERLPAGIYYLRVELETGLIVKKFNLIR